MAKLDVNVNQLNSDIQGIKSAIIEANVEVPDGTPTSEYGGLVGSVYEAGAKSEYDKFWDNFQQNGERTDYTSAFGAMWTPEIFKPKYPIRPRNAYFMFFHNGAKGLDILDFVEFCNENNVVLDYSQCTNAYYGIACLRSQHYGELNFSKCTNMGGLFYGHNTDITYSVRTIDNFISSETTKFSNDTFQHAIYLKNITMSGVVATNINFGACPLSRASIESVVSVLSEEKSGLSVTFKKSAVNDAFGIDVDDETTFPEGSDYYELRNSKSNWTFNYV